MGHFLCIRDIVNIKVILLGNEGSFFGSAHGAMSFSWARKINIYGASMGCSRFSCLLWGLTHAQSRSCWCCHMMLMLLHSCPIWGRQAETLATINVTTSHLISVLLQGYEDLKNANTRLYSKIPHLLSYRYVATPNEPRSGFRVNFTTIPKRLCDARFECSACPICTPAPRPSRFQSSSSFPEYKRGKVTPRCARTENDHYTLRRRRIVLGICKVFREQFVFTFPMICFLYAALE